MLDINELEKISDEVYYDLYQLPNEHVLFVSKQFDEDGTELTEAKKGLNYSSTFSCAAIYGKQMIRKEECTRFTIQTVDVAKDEPDTGMMILMVQK